MTATNVEPAFRAYFAMYSGAIMEFTAKEEALVDSLFHDDLVMVLGDKEVHKDGLKATVKKNLEVGTTVEIQEFKVLDDDHIEYKVRVVQPGMEMIGHSVAAIKDSKFSKIVPYDGESYKHMFADVKWIEE